MLYEYDPYKVTTIRIRKTDFNILKDIAKEDNRSINYIINKIIIEYITSHPDRVKEAIIDDILD